jgi:hypothetical protein
MAEVLLKCSYSEGRKVTGIEKLVVTGRVNLYRVGFQQSLLYYIYRQKNTILDKMLCRREIPIDDDPYQ